MVVVKLTGGLGNQLFQYAAARRLSVFHHTILKLDGTLFEHYRLRKYSLSPFRILESFATPQEIAEVKGFSKKGVLRIALAFLRNLKRNHRSPIFTEPLVRPFDPSILKTPKDVYLDGYWQSEKYFVDIQDIIRREFTIKYAQDPQSQEVAEHIASTQSVSVHVRRSDYVSDSETNRTHGSCDLDYYKQCVSLITGKITNPHFFVFSDEPSWTTKNLRLNYPTTFVTHNDSDKAYEDLRLISMCKHNIVANSSFSWWGAWLNPNPDKIVLGPKKWFNDPGPGVDASDIIPPRWIQV